MLSLLYGIGLCRCQSPCCIAYEQIPGFCGVRGCGVQVYADLEESNLFLIQVCQEAEEAVEELRGQDAATREQLNSAAAALQVRVAGGGSCGCVS